MSDDDLRRAVKSALGDIAATAPRRDDVPVDQLALAPRPNRQRPYVAIAAGLTAAAGVIGVLVIRSDPNVTTDIASASVEPTVTPTTSVSPTTTAATTATTTSPPSVVLSVYDEYLASGVRCGAGAAVPDGVTITQMIEGDVDGDEAADTVQLYALDGTWHVNVTASATGTVSDTDIRVFDDESMELSFEDIDDGAGAVPPRPQVVMARGAGANDEGRFANYTFLSLTDDGCVRQWFDRDRMFQWAVVQEPGHLTGMICETAAGTRYTALVDAIQGEDGPWTVEALRLTHDGTDAVLERLPDETVEDSGDVAARYGNITGCTHPPLNTTTPPPT